MARSLFYDTVQKVDCPKCGQKAGNYCRYPSGGRKHPPHKERGAALKQSPTFNLSDYRVRKL
jgi:hypothetical protein